MLIMEENRIIKRYKKNDFSILWEPKKCIHAAICVKELPEVYDPKGKPWIKPESASITDLKTQIDLCPSGALSYEDKGLSKEKTSMATEVELMKNGPLLVKGNIELKSHDGSVIMKEKMTAFAGVALQVINLIVMVNTNNQDLKANIDMVSLVKRINFRLYYAIGVDGNQGLFFGIMNAF